MDLGYPPPDLQIDAKDGADFLLLLDDRKCSLLRSWLLPHRGIFQEKLPLYFAFFQFVHNTGKRGKALLNLLVEGLLA